MDKSAAARKRAGEYLTHLQAQLIQHDLTPRMEAAIKAVKPLGCYQDSEMPVLQAPRKSRQVVKEELQKMGMGNLAKTLVIWES